MPEFDYIAWLRSRTPSDPRVLIGPGDDAAVLAPTTRPLILTKDVLTEGVDFRLGEVEPRRIGRKAMKVNLSDIAAMAARPTAALVGLVLPRSGGEKLAEELYHGLRDVADEFQVAIVGGDTNSWDDGLVISVTVIGEATERGPVPRSGAKPGDWILVSGPLGGSLLGHHFDFTPRVREALALHAATELHAMIDISDGLAADVNHILEESRCGAVLLADMIPITPAAVEMSRTSGKSALQHALADGEDFELVFAVSPADGERLVQKQPVPGIQLTQIGECVESGLWLEENENRRPLAPAGWVHELS